MILLYLFMPYFDYTFGYFYYSHLRTYFLLWRGETHLYVLLNNVLIIYLGCLFKIVLYLLKIVLYCLCDCYAYCSWVDLNCKTMFDPSKKILFFENKCHLFF